jgi:hypothetical protein
MSIDPWAAAAAPTSSTVSGDTTTGSTSTPNTDQLTGNNSGYDPLFGGEKLVALFDKTIGIGVERTGIITDAPKDRQSRFFKAGGSGALKFWGPDGKPTADANGPDGKPLNPCMDTVFVLDTDYRLNPAELADKGMDEDSGQRGVFASGAQLKAIKDAIRQAQVSSREQLKGMRLTLKRTGKKPAGDFEAWTWAAKIEKA